VKKAASEAGCWRLHGNTGPFQPSARRARYHKPGFSARRDNSAGCHCAASSCQQHDMLTRPVGRSALPPTALKLCRSMRNAARRAGLPRHGTIFAQGMESNAIPRRRLMTRTTPTTVVCNSGTDGHAEPGRGVCLCTSPPTYQAALSPGGARCERLLVTTADEPPRRVTASEDEPPKAFSLHWPPSLLPGWPMLGPVC